MTLLAVWKDGNEIKLASDSRLTLNGGEIDTNYKISTVNINVFRPTNENDEKELMYNGQLGIGLVGSFISAYSIKEALQNLLSSLQYVDIYEDLSFDTIADLILSFFEQLTQSVTKVLANKGLGQLILTGYCPQKKNNRAFVFSIDSSSYPVKAEKKELFKVKDYEFFGSGRKKAYNIKQSNLRMSMFNVIKKVINDDSIPSVGGSIQYGYTQTKKFIIKGIQDYFYNDDEKKIYVGYFLAGLELYKKQLKNPFFHINQSFIIPFDNDIISLLKKGYVSVNDQTDL